MRKIVIALIFLGTPAYANTFEDFLNGKNVDSHQEQAASQEETNRQLIVLQKAMIDRLKEDTRTQSTQLERMRAEIDVLKNEIAQLKQTKSNSISSDQQRQINELRGKQEQQKRDMDFNELESRHREGEAEIMREWDKKSLRNDIESKMNKALENN